MGANGLIVADLAIVIELPSPVVIAVLRQLKARFPKSDEAKVRLNLDALGEFIKVGARLLLLKSRALLPRVPRRGSRISRGDWRGIWLTPGPRSCRRAWY